MSLATRCAHCETTFRVVQDQLKVSEGWVRCGRCGQVFNALEGLFDLDREGPISGSTPLGPAEAPSPRPADDGTSLEARTDAPAAREPEPANPVDAADVVSDFDATETQLLPREDAQAPVPIPFADDSRLGDEATPSQLEATDSELAEAAALAAPDDTATTARFLRDAQRAADWQRPRVRASLGVAATLLALLLAAQWVVQRRDVLSARWPQAAQALVSLCDVLGCVVEAPRHIEALAVESSALTRLEGSDHYQLQVSLRNRDAMAVLSPALDLALTDSAGDTVVRRVLTVADFGPGTAPRLSPGGELNLTAVIDVGTRRVAGYTIELFYP
ncbi:MAG TPA: zinc-ribbon and DUF3426 domain-containing protein [Burkholderiaceae bacterium]|nr:zinc-ribbon and DUF3426 domain-containing protein [Burkholderiaceae bacterium]